MKLQALVDQLRVDEGQRLTVYKDTKGLPTVGVGHLVRPLDRLSVGDIISQDRANEWFYYDVLRTLLACETRIEGWSDFPGEVQEILANMAFNLGIDGLLTFKNTLACICRRDYAGAANGMENSRWYKQVGYRSKRLVARMRALCEPQQG